MYWLYVRACKWGFSPSIETCSEHKHGVFSDMEVKTKILINMYFIFITSSIVHVHVKIIALPGFKHLFTSLIRKFFYHLVYNLLCVSVA